MNSNITRTKRNWTTEEDNIVINHIKSQQFKNLSQAFRELAKNLILSQCRTEKSIALRYNNSLRHNHEMFYLSNEKGALMNTKYVPEDKTPDFKPVEVVMKQLLNLTKKERDSILAFFK